MITGASSGFGEATARKLVEHGALVALGARRVDRLEALAKDIGMDKVVYKTMDVSIKSDVKALADLCIEKFGKIDALINNAGIMPLSMLAAGRTEEWDQIGAFLRQRLNSEINYTTSQDLIEVKDY